MVSWSQYILGNHGSKKLNILLKFASLSKEQKYNVSFFAVSHDLYDY